MAGPAQNNVRNWLLRALARDDYELLRPHLQYRDTPKGMRVIDPDRRPAFGYFFESGLGSVIADVPSGQAVEIGLYGVDGFGGIPLVLESSHSPHRLDMQIGGSAHVVPSDVLEALLRTRPALRALMLRYVQFFLLQSGITCLSNALRPMESRLARWLLMSHDRMPDDDVPLTHEYLSIMLGASRTTVTQILGELADAAMIATSRGSIRILDRPGLRRLAGDSYGIPEKEYNRLISPHFGNAAETRDVNL